ncbi:uncharacterized protein LOC132785168 [Drosophila nasuta]|uniref:uncharacterized protein LOC132785168 n=1 Tax=Drosophila nasuta TaxID=42062 RepID=UPI00295F2A6F|nr:uncharacterized protein LOC132785168 [Drosophila nasuta]
MSAISFFNRCICVLLFLLLNPGQVFNNFLNPETATLKINFLKNITENVLKEKNADTLLLLQRGQDINCPLNIFIIDGLPILRLDESTVVPIKFVYNSQAIALICMSELADSILLSVLAKNLDRMRDARILIWLESSQENLEECLNIICDYARKYNFVNLIVLHSSNSLQKSIVAYRLQPFPDPSLRRISHIFISTIFPEVWHNFHNKSALLIPSLYPPSSFIRTDRKSGEPKLVGHLDVLMFEFAKKHNINVKLLRPLNKLVNVSPKIEYKLVLNNKVDFATYFSNWAPDMECTSVVNMAHQFIVVPCGKPIGIGDVYKSLKNFVLMILVVYLIISLVTTLVEAATCRIFGRTYRFSYGNLFVNLNAFRWVFGISSDVHRDRRSMSLHQIIMVMCIFSMIGCCFFNANLSTFLTKRPQYGTIKNFKELKESRLPVVYADIFREIVLKGIKAIELNLTESQIVFVPNKKRIRMILAQNTSNAYHIFDKFWEAIKKYQQNYKREVLCQTPGLNIFGVIPNQAILPPNSIYLQALNNFIDWAQDLGLNKHWIQSSINQMIAYSTRSQEHSHATPLNFDDLKWVWYLLGLCYITSILVFVGEICVKFWQTRRQPRLQFVV